MRRVVIVAHTACMHRREQLEAESRARREKKRARAGPAPEPKAWDSLARFEAPGAQPAG